MMIAYIGSKLNIKFTVNAGIFLRTSANVTYRPTVQNDAKITKYPVSFNGKSN